MTDINLSPERLQAIINEIAQELAVAMVDFPPIHSGHEGYAVIKEELDELWAEVRLKSGTPQGRRREAIQVAAMGIRFVYDVSDNEL